MHCGDRTPRGEKTGAETRVIARLKRLPPSLLAMLFLQLENFANGLRSAASPGKETVCKEKETWERDCIRGGKEGGEQFWLPRILKSPAFLFETLQPPQTPTGFSRG